MIRFIFAASCMFVCFAVEGAGAAPVSEATVEKACGGKIEGGCAGATCATGCEKVEGGKLYTYGCTFPNKAGKTKASCSRTPITKSGPDKSGKKVGKAPSILKAD